MRIKGVLRNKATGEPSTFICEDVPTEGGGSTDFYLHILSDESVVYPTPLSDFMRVTEEAKREIVSRMREQGIELKRRPRDEISLERAMTVGGPVFKLGRLWLKEDGPEHTEFSLLIQEGGEEVIPYPMENFDLLPEEIKRDIEFALFREGYTIK